LVFDGSTRSTAMSDDASVPSTSAATPAPLSSKRTWTSLAPDTTWALVTMVPASSTRKPVPLAVPAALSRLLTKTTLGLAAA
jgi:hypothetical protein